MARGSAYCANNGETEIFPRLTSSSRSSGKAQQPDGYLNTYFTVCHPELFAGRTHRGPRALQRRPSHHRGRRRLHYNATGKRRLLDIAAKFADLICKPSATARGSIPGYPGHQEIELAS